MCIDFDVQNIYQLCVPYYKICNYYFSGLEDQMLGIAVAEERPDLEEAKNQLIVSNAKMKQELKEIENKILYRLSISEGSPVDDIDLINILEASKIKAMEISVSGGFHKYNVKLLKCKSTCNHILQCAVIHGVLRTQNRYLVKSVLQYRVPLTQHIKSAYIYHIKVKIINAALYFITELNTVYK